MYLVFHRCQLHRIRKVLDANVEVVPLFHSIVSSRWKTEEFRIRKICESLDPTRFKYRSLPFDE